MFFVIALLGEMALWSMESGTKFRLSIIVTAYMELRESDQATTDGRRSGGYSLKNTKSRERESRLRLPTHPALALSFSVDNIQPPPSKRRGLQ